MRCVICGKEIEKSAYAHAALCSDECFLTHFWREIISEKEKYLIINGVCYSDGGNEERPDCRRFLGCSGRRFWIRKDNGETLTTNNLWCQGDIPNKFRAELPDNAEFYFPKDNMIDLSLA